MVYQVCSLKPITFTLQIKNPPMALVSEVNIRIQLHFCRHSKKSLIRKTWTTIWMLFLTLIVVVKEADHPKSHRWKLRSIRRRFSRVKVPEPRLLSTIWAIPTLKLLWPPWRPVQSSIKAARSWLEEVSYGWWAEAPLLTWASWLRRRSLSPAKTDKCPYIFLTLKTSQWSRLERPCCHKTRRTYSVSKFMRRPMQ